MKKNKNYIKKISTYYDSLSILKKFLLAPILSVLFILPFYIYILSNTVDMKSDMEQINSELVPLYESTFENIILLEKILNELNNAVVSKELDWVNGTDIHANKIRTNIKMYFHGNYTNEAKIILKSFDEYIKSAKNVSIKLINNNYNYENINKDTVELVKKYNNIFGLLNNLKFKLKNNIEQNINSIYKSSNSIVSKGSYIFIVWFIVSILIVYYVYRDLEFRINQIVEQTKQIASGDADFNKRLCLVSYDEFGKIVRSINIFINKLHKNHEELALAKDKLNQLYVVDQLTQLYNRIKIDEIMDIELIRTKRYGSIFSIILIDIDHFKLVNDTYGHIVGDSVLKEFASILKANVRDSDCVGRWGGEEFIIVCIETDTNGAVLVAEKLRDEIEKFNFTTVGNKTASFGVSSSGKNIDETIILDNADKALYKAKNSGRNQVISYSNL